MQTGYKGMLLTAASVNSCTVDEAPQCSQSPCSSPGNPGCDRARRASARWREEEGRHRVARRRRDRLGQEGKRNTVSFELEKETGKQQAIFTHGLSFSLQRGEKRGGREAALRESRQER